MRKNLKKLAGILILAAAVSGGYIFLRSPQVSNYLKETVSRGFESQTGYELTAGRLYANLFPFYVGARNVRIFDDRGDMIFSARGIKAYVGLSALLSKKIFIKRLALSGPDIRMAGRNIEHFLDISRRKRPPGGFTLKLGTVVVADGSLSYARQAGGPGGLAVSCRGLDAEALLSRDQVRMSCRNISVSAKDIPRISAKLDTAKASFRDGVLKIDAFSLESAGSTASLSGGYTKAGGVRLSTRIRLLIATLKDVFGLEKPDQGELQLAGEVRLPGFNAEGSPAVGGNKTPFDWNKTYIDMDVKGGLYAQTLLEFLHANVNVAGFAKVDAHVEGPLDNLAGSGEGSLQKAVIYGASADNLDFALKFQNGLLSFDKIRGRLYGGQARGSFSINLPKVRTLNIDVAFSDLNSRKFLAGFLKLHLPLPAGRLSGRMVNRTASFAPDGDFQFHATSLGRDFTGRIRSITSGFALAGNTVIFSQTHMKTALTTVDGNGAINYGNSTINMDFSMRTDDFKDLTLPYSTLAEGSGGFDGSVSGPIKDPTFNGRIFASRAVVLGMKSGTADGVITYDKDQLQIQRLQAETGGQKIDVTGRMLFPKAKEIFELAQPVYDLDIKLGESPASRVARLISPALEKRNISGTIVSADLKVTGAAPELSGRVNASDVACSGVHVSSARFDFDYKDGDLSIAHGVLMKDGAAVKLSGELLHGKQFNFNAQSDGVGIKDLFPGRKLPVDYRMSFKASGRGTLEKPRLSVEGRLTGGRYEGHPVKGGEFKLDIISGPGGKKASIDASLQDERIILKGQALLEGDLPWQADIALKNGRYDYLVSPFLKNVPPDLFVSLQGRGQFSGTKKAINGSLVLNQLAFTAFGQSFSAERPFSLDVRDKTLNIRSLDLSGARTGVQISGTVALGRGYDVNIEGKSSLAPMKSFLKQANMLTGDASYVFHVGGNWGRPDISGDLSLSNAVIGITGMPENLRIISAYMYIDENRIVLEKFSSKVGGGQLGVTGVVYLKKLKPAKYYFDGVLKNAGISVEGVDATLDGNFVVSGDPGARDLTGEVFIRKAAYRKNVDLKGLIFKKKAVRPPSPRSFEATTGLSLRVYGSRNIMVANNVARAPLSVDLTVMGTLAKPIPLGRVEASRGKIYFRNTEFSIEHASVIFADPNRIDPALDIMASSTIKGYQITINMAGTTNGLNLAFSSQPHLQEPDILSLLTTGSLSSASSSTGTGGGVDYSEASSFLTGQFQNVITKRLKSITGFERFDIAPYVSQKTGTVSPRVTVSKRLLGDKLFVIYSAPIGTEEQIIRMEYAVSPKVSIVGTRDDTGDLGGDVEFRLKFR
ncbi:MAG: translocation/assembly module TamB domain-containing protein [Nitrospiraceae bacterium]|nr:translocation/assembly module TamB domain-containing protein [Nitrospiraceae bacterium]